MLANLSESSGVMVSPDSSVVFAQLLSSDHSSSSGGDPTTSSLA